jgi:excisionase family DNA binding protein
MRWRNPHCLFHHSVSSALSRIMLIMKGVLLYYKDRSRSRIWEHAFSACFPTIGCANMYTGLLTEDETAQYLKLSRSTLRRLRSKNATRVGMPQLPFCRCGRKVRYDMDDLRRWIAQCKQETAAAPAAVKDRNAASSLGKPFFLLVAIYGLLQGRCIIFFRAFYALFRFADQFLDFLASVRLR